MEKDSFFLSQKNFPKDYESIISSSKWKLLGTYNSGYKKISIADSSSYESIRLFDDGKYYRKIKGNKIASNSDFGLVKIIYVDASTLILESKKKTVTRQLLRIGTSMNDDLSVGFSVDVIQRARGQNRNPPPHLATLILFRKLAS